MDIDFCTAKDRSIISGTFNSIHPVMNIHFTIHRSPGPWLILVSVLMLAGCQTPDLKPFATASAQVATAIKQGGDLAVDTLAKDPMLVDGELVQPGEPNHPATQIRETWRERRRSAEALMVYSASLAAINDASTNRKQNAAQLVDAVDQLARSVPGVGVGIGSAGDLAVKVMERGVEVFVEVKAWHNMAKAVRAADPAVQKIAAILKDDFASLGNAYEPKMNDKINHALLALREPQWTAIQLKKARDEQRRKVAAAPQDKSLGDELARLDALVDGVGPEVAAQEAELARLREEKERGARLFAAAASAVDAWAKAHADIVNAFEQRRLPNLVLLQARAQEVAELVDEIKALHHTAP